jgi:hypothetical protein
MTFNFKNRSLISLSISLLMLTLSPLIPVTNHSKVQPKNNFNDVANSNDDNSIINTILGSFGLENRVFADCNTYPNSCNITAPDICVPEGISTTESIQAAEQGYQDTYPVSIDIQNLSGISASPTHGDFNNYPAGTPSNQSVTLNYSATGPAVSITDDPGDNSGPYSGLGRKKFSVNAHAVFQTWDGSAWNGGSNALDQAFTINVDHVNNAPTVGTASPDYSTTVASSSTLTDVPISISFNDVESNHMNVVVDLSSDNFSTILQTHTFSAVSAGTVLNYTFAGLTVGSYQWRATATETDAIGYCGGAGVNLQSAVTKDINLGTSNNVSNVSSSAPVSSPSCSNQKPNTPSGLTAVQGPDSGQETLTWFAPDGPVTDYSITYSDNLTSKKWGVPSTGDVTTYVISGLGNGKYYFWVNAVNGCMPGDPISSVNAPLPPTGPMDIIYFGIFGMISMAIGGYFLIYKPT